MSRGAGPAPASRPGSPERLRLRLPTHTAAALAWGPRDGRLVVALHGFPDTAWAWRHVGPLLAERGLRVVAPFTRGYAPSTLPDDGCYHLAALMADAVEVHRAVGGDERAVLLGHDWGALTANGLAAHPRSPYAGVVSVAVPPLGAIAPPSPRVLLRQARRSRYIALHQLPALPERTLVDRVPGLWAAWSPGYADAAVDVAHVRAALPTADHRRAAIATYRGLLRPAPRAYRSWGRAWTGLPRVPLRYLHGADDGCLDVRLVAGLERRLPDGAAAAIVPRAGHFVPVERPDAVADAVLGLLARLEERLD